LIRTDPYYIYGQRGGRHGRPFFMFTRSNIFGDCPNFCVNFLDVELAVIAGLPRTVFIEAIANPLQIMGMPGQARHDSQIKLFQFTQFLGQSRNNAHLVLPAAPILSGFAPRSQGASLTALSSYRSTRIIQLSKNFNPSTERGVLCRALTVLPGLQDAVWEGAPSVIIPPVAISAAVLYPY
jgi:hypothetical protein